MEDYPLKRILGVGNIRVKVGFVDGGTIKFKQKNPAGGNKGNEQKNKINNVKNNRGVALADIGIE